MVRKEAEGIDMEHTNEVADDFRGEVCMILRANGHDDLANEYGAVSDERTQEDHDDYSGDADAVARLIVDGGL